MSNFVHVYVVLDGVTYPTIEHAYQAAKTFDIAKRQMIQLARTPGLAKKFGQDLVLRPDWEQVKEEVMLDLLIQKFSQPHFRKLLLATGDAYLEETNSWKDRYWGVCGGRGLNRLGHLLMQVRKMLQDLEGSTQGV